MRQSSLYVKLSVSVRMDFLENMDTDAKRGIRPKTLGLTYLFLSISWIILLHLSPEMRIFAYPKISWEEFEYTLWSSLIGESSVDAYRLTYIGFYTLLTCLTWWICPSWRVPSILERLVVSDLDSFPCGNTWSSIIEIGETWGLEPGGRYWGPVSCEPSY